ncbi:BrxA/BrxB family bacilliredoxin [Macrococcus armenti]|uniref:BrxA/BrxB family bacilliredoxin n=1 Tax=Macrococcus armenti TaxID=2875764 RepID=A0ABY3ZS26_9STAP|nr:BrxA/BrxB family bacilliredoxin [Macrococcus armenti]UBH12258.1 BrxA/BrxB family bacilliredoxin [Macrococcus armenti]UBH21398.1 BrxA/BrxB family bacilliredoxin [Macrococcus armenti]UOB19699.1 BrxA/BrxB family bacilliredoxin [Macrococcus armenti]
MDMNFNMYMEDFINTARQEIESAGYKQLTTPEAVTEAFNKPGTTFVMINSVCGCAGGIARPAAAHAIHYDKVPNQLVTVFAGQDKEATATAREYFEGYPPSSPSFALLKDGKIISMIERHEIEGHDPMSVITSIQALFEEHCEER